MTIKPGIEFIAPFRIYLPESFFEVKVGEKISLVKPIALPPISIGGTQTHGKNIEISHDIFGYAGRTKYSVIIDEEIDIKKDNWKHLFSDNESKFFDLALLSVNRVLEVYRDQDRNNLDELSFHIVQLTKNDVYDIRFIALDEELNQIDNLVIRRPFFHSMGIGKAVERKPFIIEEIRRFLKDGSSLPIYRELLLSALNFNWHGQFHLVPIEANTAFESFIPEIIRLLDSSVSISRSDNLYNKLLKLENILSTTLALSNHNPVTWFLDPQKGWKNNIVQSEIQIWYDDCYDLRNRVIHEGFHAVSKEESINSYKASLNVINYIQTEVRKTIPI